MYEISKILFYLSFSLKKKKQKNRATFFLKFTLNFRNKSGFFSNWKNRNPDFSKYKKFILAKLHFKKIKNKLEKLFCAQSLTINTERARLAWVEFQHRTFKASSGEIPAQNVQD